LAVQSVSWFAGAEKAGVLSKQGNPAKGSFAFVADCTDAVDLLGESAASATRLLALTARI
jgi:hypothetical protein